MDLFWPGFLLSLSLCLDLGIVNVAAMRAGVQDGARAALALGVGSCCGDLIYAGLALAGVTALLDIAAVRWTLWVGGTGVLLWLAGKALRDAWRPATFARPDRVHFAAVHLSLRRYFSYGLALALSSPSAILWFATAGGAVIATTAGGSRAAAAWFFAGFFLSGLAWSAFIAIVSSRGRRLGGRFVRGFAAASAVLFAALAVKVFAEGYAVFAR